MDKPQIDIEKMWELRRIYRRVANSRQATSNKKPAAASIGLQEPPRGLFMPTEPRVEQPTHTVPVRSYRPWEEVDAEFPLPGGDMLTTSRRPQQELRPYVEYHGPHKTPWSRDGWCSIHTRHIHPKPGLVRYV